MDFDKFTLKAQEAIQEAHAAAQKADHTQIDCEHLLLALIEADTGAVAPLLERLGAHPSDLTGEIEAEQRAPDWRGHSDTETLLACIEAWGVEATLKRGVGMFAFALWDRQARTLVLARDRAGEKPLYYGWQGDTFLFGSELKALRAHPAFNASVDRGALALLLRHNYIPAPYSIHQGIFKLPPGTWLQLTQGQRDAQPEAYWSLADVAERGMANPFTGSDAEAVDELARLMGRAVAGQQLADEYDVHYLGAIPLEANVGTGGDSGEPIVVAHPDSAASQASKGIARNVAARVSVFNLGSRDSNFIPIEMIG